jgi:16S rRNA processing protein RimM
MPADAIEVGRVVGAWGVKGGFKVEPYAKDPQALFSSKRWFLLPPEKAIPSLAGKAPVPPLLKVMTAKQHGDGVVVQAQEIDDRTAAEALRGARIFVARSSFPTAGDGEYYWVDLMGLTVTNLQGQTLGTVADLIDTGAHSVLRVTADGAEHLVPFVAAYIGDVSLAQRRITVDWQADWSA